MRIKAHGMMKTDARLVTDVTHMKRHADDRGPEQLVNTAALPGIVGEAWAMADWHYGYGFPIGGVVATDTEAGELGVLYRLEEWALTSIAVCAFSPLKLAEDIPNLKKLAGRLAGRILPEAPERVALTSDTKISTNCFNEVHMLPLI